MNRHSARQGFPPGPYRSSLSLSSAVAVDVASFDVPLSRPAELTNSRLAVVDALRGVLIVLMCSTHALTLSGVPTSHWLWTTWLPRGWGTHGFVILSGFGLAYLLGMSAATPRRRWARRRAWQLLVIAVLSNVVFGLTQVLTSGSTAPLTSGSWWLARIAFGEPYSISAVLLPTAALVFVVPVLVCRFDPDPRQLVAVTAGVTLVAGWLTTWRVDHVLWERMIQPGLGGFPLLLMWCEGLLGFALGSLFKRSRDPVPFLLAALVAVAILTSIPSLPWLLGWIAVERLATLAAVTTLLSLSTADRLVLPTLATLGRFPLLAFLGHRIVMHLLVGGTSAYALPPVWTYWVLFGGVLAILLSVAAVRRRFDVLDGGFRAMWL